MQSGVTTSSNAVVIVPTDSPQRGRHRRGGFRDSTPAHTLAPIPTPSWLRGLREFTPIPNCTATRAVSVVYVDASAASCALGVALSSEEELLDIVRPRCGRHRTIPTLTKVCCVWGKVMPRPRIHNPVHGMHAATTTTTIPAKVCRVLWVVFRTR